MTLKEALIKGVFAVYKDSWGEAYLELPKVSPNGRHEPLMKLHVFDQVFSVLPLPKHYEDDDWKWMNKPQPSGCGKRLADGQWWTRCGANDFGSFPALCTECGGEYILAPGE